MMAAAFIQSRRVLAHYVSLLALNLLHRVVLLKTLQSLFLSAIENIAFFVFLITKAVELFTTAT